MSEEKTYLKKILFKKELKNLAEMLSGKRILIYGAGALFETACKLYNLKQLNIIGISDKKFEENLPSEFLGFKTYKPCEINNVNPEYILVATKEYGKLLNILNEQYPNISIIPLFKKKSIDAYTRRNIMHNIWIASHGLHNKKPRKMSWLEEKQIWFNNLIGKIDIPQIEFNITTKCTLRCKHCSNYIPQLQPNEHRPIKIEDFKIQLDNLLNAVHKVRNLLLLGGEPLTVKNLNEYIEYAASKKKVERVWVVTNGTLLMNEELCNTAKKYKNKLTIWISNYSKNVELKSKLRHEELLKQIKEAGLDYDYTEDLNWWYISPINTEKLRTDSEHYFSECKNNCVAVFDGKIYVCPRAGVYDIKGIYNPENGEVPNLNKKIKSSELKRFYSRKTFSACNYCQVLEDKKNERVIPALQITD